MPKYQIAKYRIAKCKETKKDIVQILEDNGQWLCLHNLSEQLDRTSVDAFLAGSGGKRNP